MIWFGICITKKDLDVSLLLRLLKNIKVIFHFFPFKERLLKIPFSKKQTIKNFKCILFIQLLSALINLLKSSQCLSSQYLFAVRADEGTTNIFVLP